MAARSSWDFLLIVHCCSGNWRVSTLSRTRHRVTLLQPMRPNPAHLPSPATASKFRAGHGFQQVRVDPTPEAWWVNIERVDPIGLAHGFRPPRTWDNHQPSPHDQIWDGHGWPRSAEHQPRIGKAFSDPLSSLILLTAYLHPFRKTPTHRTWVEWGPAGAHPPRLSLGLPRRNNDAGDDAGDILMHTTAYMIYRNQHLQRDHQWKP